MIEFNDGSTAEIGGELRLEESAEGWRVLGDGMYFPVACREEGEALLRSIGSQGVYFSMKWFKSEGFRSKVRNEIESLGTEGIPGDAGPGSGIPETSVPPALADGVPR